MCKISRAAKIYEFINSTIGNCFEVALLSFLREYWRTLSGKRA